MRVQLGAFQIIRDFTQEEKIRITDDLSLSNPAYIAAKKFTSYSRISLPMYLMYYQQVPGALIVPRGYEIPFPYEKDEDERFTLENVVYPPFRLKLRDAQQEAEDAYIKGRKDGSNGLLILPTGKGKSILGLHIACRLKQRLLVIVHKDDLVDGWKKDAKLALGLRPKQVGIIKGKVFRIGKQVTIATIQTLSRLSPEQIAELKKIFSMVIVDECHHTPARTFEYVNMFPAYDRIGLTATNMRNDGLGQVINFFFGEVCYEFKETDDDEDIIAPKDVIIKLRESDVKYNPPTEYLLPNSRHVAEYIHWNGKTRRIADLYTDEIDLLIKLGKLKRKPLDYNKVMKTIWMNDDFAYLVATDIIKEWKQKKSCLVLCIEKEHCRMLYDILVSYGIPSKELQLYYGDSTDSKPRMKAKAESKQRLVTIATYTIAKEGTNVKAWERIFLAMTINNELDLVQAIGRGRRKLEGKENCVVYDYRHPGVKGARGHGDTRDEVYSKRGFKVLGSKSTVIVSKYPIRRGFKAREA